MSNQAVFPVAVTSDSGSCSFICQRMNYEGAEESSWLPLPMGLLQSEAGRVIWSSWGFMAKMAHYVDLANIE